MPMPINPTSFGKPTGGSSIMSTITDALTIAQQGAQVYSSVNAARQRPTPATNSNNADGSAKSGSQSGPSVVGIVILGAILVFGGILAVRYLMK